MNQRHATRHGRFEAQLDTANSRRSQQLGTVSRKQHLVGGHHRRPALDCPAHPLASGIHTTDHFDDDVGRRREDLLIVVGPGDRTRHPRCALSRDITVEDVRQLQPTGKLGPFDQNLGDGGANGTKSKKGDFERSLRHCSTV